MNTSSTWAALDLGWRLLYVKAGSVLRVRSGLARRTGGPAGRRFVRRFVYTGWIYLYRPGGSTSRLFQVRLAGGNEERQTVLTRRSG